LEMKQLINGQELIAPENLALLSLFSHLRNQEIAEFQVGDPQGRSRYELGLPETPPDMINQVKNAAEATPQWGRVTLRTRGDLRAIFLEFEDTGQGITPEYLNELFEK
jgi:hypothetical protein